jgi:hypothetical protein
LPYQYRKPKTINIRYDIDNELKEIDKELIDNDKEVFIEIEKKNQWMSFLREKKYKNYLINKRLEEVVNYEPRYIL